ncbi:MAG: hypothetical protein HQK75_01965 [Candidatus Magnetomorum sp.]|nr:hypothetical protein [Candidatus Magnetomorum sp.]
MNHYKGIHQQGLLRGIVPFVLIVSAVLFSSCMNKHTLPSTHSFHSEFAGLHHLLLLECETIPSNVNAGIFSASGQDADRIALVIGEAFRNVPHIRLSHIPFTKDSQESKLIPQLTPYDALLSGKIWWQLNAEHDSQASKYEFDLILQLKLHRKDENATIQTRNFYIPVMSREGIIIKNQLFFCQNDSERLESFFQTDTIPQVSRTILTLTQDTRKISVKKPPIFFDLKSQILFESKAYYALIYHIIESRLSQNSTDTIPLFLNAHLADAVNKVIQNIQSRKPLTHASYAKKYHADLYTLGLCFEKTGRIKNALSCYRFVMKHAPDHSQLCADGIGRCLKTMGIRDHIQWSKLNSQSDPAFQLAAMVKDETDDVSPKNVSETKEIISSPIMDVISTPLQPSEPSVSQASADMENDEMIAIQIMIDQWLSAWRSMKSDEYFHHYAEDFEPENTISLYQWKKQRKERLKRQAIFVSIVGEINITFQSQTQAVATFIQDFESKGFYYKDRTEKRLDLKKVKNSWKIQKEQVVEVIP